LIDEEGVGETSGQRPDRLFGKRSRFPEEDPAEETVFLRTVRIAFKSAVSPQAFLADVRSGPDVFADALVPRPERAAPGVPFPKHHCFDAACKGRSLFAPWLSLCEGRKVNHLLRMQQSPAAQCFS
jgi:hypothetical protein